MTSNPLVSFVVPAWNAATTLDETLASIAAQANPSWEAIVVDDGSDDGTGAIVAAWIGREPRFRALSRERGGFLAARNTGLDAATGRWIAFVDADDLISPEFIDVLTCHDNADVVVGGWRRLLDGGVLAAGADFEARAIAAPIPWLLHAPIMFGSAVIGAEMARRVRFDPATRHSGDIRFWLDAALAGARFRVVAANVLRYRQSPTSLSRRDPLACLADDLSILPRLEGASIDPGVLRLVRQAAVLSCAARFIARDEFVPAAVARDHVDVLASVGPMAFVQSLVERLAHFACVPAGRWVDHVDGWRAGIEDFAADLGAATGRHPAFAAAVMRALAGLVLDRVLGQDEVGDALAVSLLAMARGHERAAPVVLDFRAGGDAIGHVARDWSLPEPWGTWSDGARPTIIVPMGHAEGDLAVSVHVARIMSDPARPDLVVRLRANGTDVADWRLDHATIGAGIALRARVPARAVGRDRILALSFEVPDARSPLSLGLSPDGRLLGIGVASIAIAPWADAP